MPEVYVIIPDSQVEPESPTTTGLLAALRDNPIAIAEGHDDAPRVKPLIFHAREERASGTNAGTLTVGVWTTRLINTIKTNTIAGASMIDGEYTLPAGTYDCIASAPGFNVNQHKIKLYNVTDAADVTNGMGSSERSTSGAQTSSTLRCRFTIAAAKALQLRHVVETTVSTQGAGIAGNLGLEVYAEIHFTKVG